MEVLEALGRSGCGSFLATCLKKYAYLELVMLVHNLNVKYKFIIWVLPIPYIPKHEL
jgi:hypothetical protein